MREQLKAKKDELSSMSKMARKQPKKSGSTKRLPGSPAF